MLRSCNVIAAYSWQVVSNKQTNKQKTQLHFENHLIVSRSELLSKDGMREGASCYFTGRAPPAKDTRQKTTSILKGCSLSALKLEHGIEWRQVKREWRTQEWAQFECYCHGFLLWSLKHGQCRWGRERVWLGRAELLKGQNCQERQLWKCHFSCLNAMVGCTEWLLSWGLNSADSIALIWIFELFLTR